MLKNSTLIMEKFRIIKMSKLLTLISFGFLILSCDLDENPPFLDDPVSLYNDVTSSEYARDGIYAAFTHYNAMEQRMFVENGYSGLFTTRRGGNKLSSVWMNGVIKLNPNENVDNQNTWVGLYRIVSRANAAIENSIYDIDSDDSSQLRINDVAGHAYFSRAYSYFSLTRLWGDIPVWTTLTTYDDIHRAKTPSKEVYTQIIEDAKQAKSLLNGSAGVGFPKAHAAKMLLAKVYMLLATNPELQDDSLSEMDYWNLAYAEAKDIYMSGDYSLETDYASLFDGTNENSDESIFELQNSQDATNSQMSRNYTPWRYKAGQAFGWFSVSASVYDYHVAHYPSDPRLDATYISDYTQRCGGCDTEGNPHRTYPTNSSRSSFGNAHPYLFKHAEKDRTHTNQFNSQNLIIYRYADLLLMLAEISNELENGEELGYVTEVLKRSDQTPHAGYLADKDSFRDAIMDEYRFELLGEGHDSSNNRRRGYAYFLENTINRHNNNPNFKASVDVLLNDVESEVMFLDIPLLEINNNELLND
jgi:hypothetical protein